jgi:DNA topoisomerase-1
VSPGSVSLRYSTDERPGIRRRRCGGGFIYVLPDGRRLKDGEAIARIRRLAIPPAYQDVWICPLQDGHLQATGRDARGRKQYRYHPLWREVRDADKFRRMAAFGQALPRIHRRVAADSRLPQLSREKILATVVRLLESTLIRVGNEQYVKENRSYGLTTLRERHVEVKGDLIQFDFRGKHGLAHRVAVSDPRAAAVVRSCLELPGQELFQYLDESGQPKVVTSSDVNDYLQEIAGEEFSAKDFRTWYATSRALEVLAGRSFESMREAKSQLMELLVQISRRLGNTPTMCRKCYVHPGVVDAFLAGELAGEKVGRRGRSARQRLLQLLRKLSSAGGHTASRRNRGAFAHGAVRRNGTGGVAVSAAVRARGRRAAPVLRA